jgi:DNA-binding NtrC family response regulator
MMSDRRILLIEQAFCTCVSDRLRDRGASVMSAPDFAAAATFCREASPQLVLIAAHPDADAETLSYVQHVRHRSPWIPIVLIVERSSEELAIAAMHAGVTRYLKHPLADADLCGIIETLCAEHGDLNGGERLVGGSSAMSTLRASIRKVAAGDSNVLITGETGTGKELVAELIHGNSARQRKPFVCVNSTAIPDSLLESELFGYRSGGKLALANSGTIFFDEIGDVGPVVQAKLLRAMDEKRIYRLGSDTAIPLDLRFLAATNQDLESALEQGRFRRDLFHRLSAVRVKLTPLREHAEDIPRLLDHYVAIFNRSFNAHVEGFTRPALDLLTAYSWPGNVRELKNVVEAVFASQPASPVNMLELPAGIKRHLHNAAKASPVERAQLVNALISTNWNKTQAAGKLHWSSMTLNRKMTRCKVLRSSTPGESDF